MFKRTFAAAVVTGAALITGFATAGTATADTRTEPGHPGHTFSVLSNACVAPWHWDGPLNVLTAGNTTSYVACNGNTVGSPDGGHHFSLVDNLCVAPWYWEGPLNVGNVGNTTDYVACNDNMVNG